VKDTSYSGERIGYEDTNTNPDYGNEALYQKILAHLMWVMKLHLSVLLRVSNLICWLSCTVLFILSLRQLNWSL